MAKKNPNRKSTTRRKALTDTKKPQTKISADDFPRRTLEAAIPVARLIRETYAGKSATWPEIAKALGVSDKNPNNRYPVWAANAYGLIKKSEDNRFSLAETGRKVLAPNYDGEDREGILKAILTPSILSKFYSDYNGSPLPGDDLFLNVLENRYSIPRDRTKEARQVILENARYANIVQDGGNGQLTLRFDSTGGPPPLTGETPTDVTEIPASAADLSNSCFIITPLGDDDSTERKHANTILMHLIEPVLAEFKVSSIRADKIAKPGIITKQIVEHLAWSRLCIADLSFNNPNAFYEMGVRHAFKLPMIQIIRKGDKIPFDVSQGRTIIIDTSDPYTIMDRFQSARTELKEHVESCLKGQEKSDDNPIGMFMPGLKVSIPKNAT